MAQVEQSRRIDIQQWVIQQHSYVLELKGVVVAYAVMHRHFFAQSFVEMLMIDPHYRRMGLGLIFLNYLKTKSFTPKLFSSTNASNIPMQALLQSAGFNACGFIDQLDAADPELIYYILI